MNKIFCPFCGKKQAYSVDAGKLLDVIASETRETYDMEAVQMKCVSGKCKSWYTFYVNIELLEEVQNA